MDETTNKDERNLWPDEEPTAAEEPVAAMAAEEPEDAEKEPQGKAEEAEDTDAGLHGLVEEVRDQEQGYENAWAESAPAPKPVRKPPVLITFLLLVIIALPALALAVGNGYIALPALRAMNYESQKRMLSAQEQYVEVMNRADKAEEVRLNLFSISSVNGTETQRVAGLSAGSFVTERVALLYHEVYGPFGSGDVVYSFTQGGARIPGSMKDVVAEFEDLDAFFTAVNEAFNTAYNEATEADPDAEISEEAEIELLKAALDEYRAADEDAEKHAPYYAYYTCWLYENDTAKLKDAIADAKKEGLPFWCYEDAERYYALKAKDFAAAEEIGKNRLARNKEDAESLIEQTRALWLQGKEDEAEDLTKASYTGELMSQTATLASAELLYRQEKYKESIALCDEVLEKVQKAPEDDTTRNTLEILALTNKSIALVLQSDKTAATKIMNSVLSSEYLSQRLTASFASAALIASFGVDDELYQSIAAMFSVIPQEVQNYVFGETTAAEIYQTGWGVIA